MKIAVIAAVALGVFVNSIPAFAHHAFAAEFDRNKPITLVGTVKKVEWTNPHTWFHIDVQGRDGKVVTWRVEGGAPNQLMRRGWNKNSLKLGEKVTVEAFQARSGEPIANASQITTSEGKVFGSPAPTQGTN